MYFSDLDQFVVFLIVIIYNNRNGLKKGKYESKNPFENETLKKLNEYK